MSSRRRRTKTKKNRVYTYYWNIRQDPAATSTWDLEVEDIIREAHPDYDFEILAAGTRIRCNSSPGDMVELNLCRNISLPQALLAAGTVDGHGLILQYRCTKVEADNQQEEWNMFWPFPEPITFEEYDMFNLYLGGQNTSGAARQHAVMLFIHYRLL